MARSEARLLNEIWDDDDFIDVSPYGQRAYLFLLSQRDLAHTGVIPLREPRWARKSRGLTADQWRADLNELAAARFVVVDWDTGEVLIRSLLRRDRIFRQPNVMRAAIDHIPLIESQLILRALAVEVARIVDENPDLTSHQNAVLSEMEKVLAERVSPKTSASAERLTPGQVFKGSAIPSGNPTPEVPGVRGVVTTVTTDSPFPVPRSPAPAPQNLLPLAALAEIDSSAMPKQLSKPPSNPEANPDFMRWWKTYPNPQKRPNTYKCWLRATAKIQAAELLERTRQFAEACTASGKDRTFIPYSATWLNGESWNDPLPTTARASPTAAKSAAPERIPADEQCPQHRDQRTGTCRHCRANRLGGDQ